MNREKKIGIRGKKGSPKGGDERPESTSLSVIKESVVAKKPIKKLASDRVYDHLLEQICQGQYLPDMRINEQLLAKEMGVSIIPVRQAIQRLIDVGWVKRIPNRGAVVEQIDFDSYDEFQHLREAYELSAIRYLAPKITEAQLAHLKKIKDALKLHDEKYAKEFLSYGKDEFQCIVRLEIDFHTSLIRMTGNTRMEALAVPLITKVIIFETSNFYTPYVFDIVVSYQKRSGRKEIGHISHQQIYEALARRDADCAEHLLRRHLVFGHDVNTIVSSMMNHRISMAPGG